MESNKELKNKDLNSVSGGSSDLDKYLKTLAGKDKKDILVDQGDGIKLDLNPGVQYEDDGNLLIIKREKGTPESDAELFIREK